MVTTSAERHTTRPFAAGAFEFAIETADDDDRLLVESLFRDLPPPSSVGGKVTVVSFLRNDVDTSSWALDGPRMDHQPALTLEAALVGLMAAVNLCALDAEPESLHLHAAAATREGRAVVIAASRNTGKTTTVAHLVARGWGFVTDETVRLSVGDNEVRGFAKPLSIKPGGTRFVDHLQPWMIPPVDDGHDSFRFVPIGASGVTVVDRGLPHLVVLLRRPSDSTSITVPVARRLHPADAVVALMQETLDAERFGSAALRLATLAAASHCYELTISTPTATAEQIEQLFELGPVEPVEVSVLPSSDAFSPGVVSVALGDRAVVHEVVSGRILALDEGAARVWKQLGGWGAEDEIDVHGPVIGPLVAQLRALGVLAGAG
jgi:hypothetical protein